MSRQFAPTGWRARHSCGHRRQDYRGDGANPHRARRSHNPPEHERHRYVIPEIQVLNHMGSPINFNRSHPVGVTFMRRNFKEGGSKMTPRNRKHKVKMGH